MDGQTVYVGVLRETYEEAIKLKEDTVITVKHSGIRINDKLIQPYFFRVRVDLSWSDLVRHYQATNYM